ncbi:hypothetical protein [Haloactinopolyspora alba]|nr:hypothetical protein [Haloactinopolyspora alba]
MTGRDGARGRPVDLGTMSPAGSDDGRTPAAGTSRPDDDGARRRWPRWLPVAVALAAGAVIGTVAAEVREGPGDDPGVRLAGMLLEPLAPLPRGEFNYLTLGIVNASTQSVDIVDAQVDGFRRPETTPAPAPVTAEPGRWVRYRTPAIPDCAAQPSEEIRVRLRTESGTTTVTMSTPSDARAVVSLWRGLCGTGEQDAPS